MDDEAKKSEERKKAEENLNNNENPVDENKTDKNIPGVKREQSQIVLSELQLI